MSDWTELYTQEGRPYYFNNKTQVTQWQKPKELIGSGEESESNYSWILHPDDGWVIGNITSDYGQGKFYAKTIDGTSFEGKWPKGLEPIPIASVNALKTIHLINDLVKLEQIDEPTIAHSLKERSKQGKIYTSVGNILISVNPFQRLPLYTATVMEKYRTNDTDKLEPHVFTIAKKCFTEVLENRGNQAVLISGESGSGKTEATKVVLQYLAECAGSPTGIEQQILRCNPILEAFGNAKTLRNNNSSRFGKWMEIHFDQKMVICGCKIINYLLEKSRVVFQANNERNYHIFYMLCVGATNEQKKKYNITSVSQFHYLNQSGCEIADGIDDVKEWKEMLEAFEALNFSHEEQTNIFDTVAGILHLGNIEFQKSGKNGETSTISNKDELEIAAKLLGLPSPKLAKELTTRVFQSQNRSSFYEVPLDVNNAAATRDSLAKYIYGKMFDWLVGRINDFLSKGIVGQTRMIGVLDIFGFEIFENNSFEQFCINYANEKLQQHFNQHTFKLEEEVYKSEGINFEHVNFIDNQIVLDLIEKKPTGLLVALDEEIRMPKGSDDTWLAKMHKAHASNERYQKPIKGISHFNIKHYAGDVLYDATGFLEKNNDTLFDGLLLLIKLSSAPLMRELFPPSTPQVQDKNSPISKNKVQEVKRVTLGGQFKQQLQNLMDVLNSTEPHYIRCIKPNSDKRPVSESFNGSMTLAQLRYSGVMEAVAIRQKGFPFRFAHNDFVFRFQCVNKMAVINEKDKKKACVTLLNEMKADLKQIQVGKTMILYKGQQNLELELKRNLAIERLIKKVQALYKGYRTRCMYERLKPIRIELQKAIKLRQVEPLKKAIATAESEDFVIRDAHEAKQLLEKILEEIRLTEIMRDLIKKCDQTPEKYVDELKSAVERANKIEMDTEEVKQVKKICETVVWRLEIAESLATSIKEGNEEKLREALEKAKKIGLDPSRPEIKDAYVELERISNENILVSNLRIALSLPPEGESDLAFTGPYIAEGITICEDGNNNGVITYTKEAMINLVEAVDNAALFNMKKAQSKALLQLGEDILKLREGLIQDQWDIVEQIVSKHQGIGGIQTPEIAASFSQLILRAKIGEVEEQIDLAIKNFDREGLAVALKKAQNFDLDIDLEKQFLDKLIELQNLLAEAINECDPQKLNMAIYQCQEFGYVLDHLDDYKQAVEKHTLVSTLIEDIEQELSVVNGKEELEKLKQRGEEMGFKGNEMTELDILLKLSQEEFIKRQMKAAVSHGDNKRKIKLSIQLKELFFARFSNQFNLSYYSNLKSPEEYAKSKLIKKQKWMDEMMIWTKKPIPTTLTQFTNQELAKTATQLFKNLLGLMGDKPINYPDQAAKEILSIGQKEDLIRSELYVQIVKQLTNNENPESYSKGIKFLKCLLQSFPPGGDFENYFEVWLKSDSKLPKHMVEEYRELLHDIVNNEIPKTLPDTSMF